MSNCYLDFGSRLLQTTYIWVGDFRAMTTRARAAFLAMRGGRVRPPLLAPAYLSSPRLGAAGGLWLPQAMALQTIASDQLSQGDIAVNQIMIAQPSIQSLLIQMRFGAQPLSTGTGFVVQGATGPLLITNRHNVTGRHQQTGQPLSNNGGVPNNIVIMHNRKGQLGAWLEREEPLYNGDAQPRWLEHPQLGGEADFVALPLTNVTDVAFYPYDPVNTGPNIAVGPAEVLSVVGFPFGLTGGGALAIWATGFVASEPNFPDQPTFLIDCRSRPGQSGSAVISHRNGGSVSLADGSTAIFGGPVTRFLGIYSGRINSESDLGIVWKASAIAELVATIAD